MSAADGINQQGAYDWIRFLGACECCGQSRYEVVNCQCGCPVSAHRLDLERPKCTRCPCKALDPTEENAA